MQLDDLIKGAQVAAYPGTPPSYPDPATDAVLFAYFITLLNNPRAGSVSYRAWRLRLEPTG